MASAGAAVSADPQDLPNRDETDCWFDAQSVLLEVTEQLQHGQMLQSDHFSLFEAMSAVEIGDPKMDAGLDTATAPTPDDLVDQGLAPLDLTGSQLIATFDRLAAMQASWHSGNSIAQTVFVCLYLLKPDRAVQNTSLSAYCEAVRASCSAVRNIVLQASVCEEEDFITHTFGLPLQPSQAPGLQDRAPKAKPLAGVSLAEDQLLTSRQDSHHQAETSGSLGSQETTALLARLRFSKSFLQAMEQIQQWDAAGLEATRKHIVRAQTELKQVVETAHLASASPVGFCPDVNRVLLGPLPPRPVQELSQEEVWIYYGKLLKDLLTVCQLASIQQWPQLQEFLHAFAKQRPGSVARSAMHMAISGKGCNTQGGGVPCWAPQEGMMCSHLCFPPPSQLPGPEAKLFVEMASIAVQGWCHAMCLNRTRQRRRHRRGMEDWANLLEHALNADASPTFQGWLRHRSAWQWQPPEHQADHPEEALGPCASWVEKSCAAVLLQHFLMGFELDLYQPKEFCMLYWYCDYLYGTVAVSAPLFLNAQPQAASSASPSKGSLPSLTPKGKHGKHKGSAKSKTPDKAAALVTHSAHLKFTVQEMQQAQVGRQMCQALMRVATGLMACGAIANPDMPFNSESTRFEQRFAAFGFMQRPMPLVYEQFISAMDISEVKPSDLLESALCNFGEARKGIAALLSTSMQSQLLTDDKLQDLKATDRVAVQNTLAGSILLKSMQEDSRLQKYKISWDFSHHSCYPAIAVKHVAAAAAPAS
ncbi:hypothetical protein ABBQ38_010276 [Trebouxia sp. C0009 RCD-2024]